MSVSYKIYQIEKPTDYKDKLIPDNLFKPVFRIVLCGPSNSGKTTFIKNILFNNSWGYNKYFNEKYLFCGSLDDCDELKQLCHHYKINDTSIQQKYDDDMVKSLFDEIEKDNMKKKQKSRVLFSFDDQVCNQLTKRNNLTTLDELATRGRHCNCSYIASTQKYKLLNNNIRCLNATHLIIFSGIGMNDLEAIAEEHNTKYNKDELLNILKTNLDKKYAFVIIDNVNHKILNNKFEEIN